MDTLAFLFSNSYVITLASTQVTKQSALACIINQIIEASSPETLTDSLLAIGNRAQSSYGPSGAVEAPQYGQPKVVSYTGYFVAIFVVTELCPLLTSK